VALASGLALRVLTALAAGRSQRIDDGTIDTLLTSLNRSIPAGTGALLVWTPPGAPGDEPDA
jgi:hypothetical protein